MSLAKTARTTTSSLKAQRSSIEPPPRATMRMSGRGILPPGFSALKPSIAAATSAGGLVALHRDGPDQNACAGSGRASDGGCRE